MQTIPAAAPVHLQQHPFLPILYAVHDVALWEHSPRGAVSAYAIDPTNGTLAFRMSQPLSLSATNPNHAVVSTDGKDLVVAARGGGSYNVLPISADGSLGPSRIIRKEAGVMEGVVASPAQPIRLLQLPGGRFILAADAGAHTLTCFRIIDEALDIVSRTSVHRPSHVALAPSGRELVVMHFDGSISTHFFDPESASIGALKQSVPAAVAGHTLLASHPHGPFVVTAGSSRKTDLAVWRTGGGNESLIRLRTIENNGPMNSLAFSPDGRTLLMAEWNTGRVVSVEFNSTTAVFGASLALTHLDGACCFAFQRA